MPQLMKTFIILCLFQQALSGTVRKEADNFVYSSQYDRKHDITDDQGMFNNIKVAKTGKLVFIAAGDSGIKVVDPDQNYDIIYVFPSTEYIEGFAITADANYVFMPYNRKFTIFDFSSRKQFVQIAQDSQIIENVDFLINNAEELVFIIQANGQIRSINIQNKAAPFHAGTTQWFPTQIYGGLISTDDNWLLICQDFQGLAIFSIEMNGDGTVTYVLAGTYNGSTQSGSQGVDITTNMNYIINIDNRMGISIGDFTALTSALTAAYPVTLTYTVKEWWPTNISLPSPYSLCVSDDDKFLFIGVLAQGIFIIDIINKLEPILYQQIIIPYHGMSIKLSFDETDLYFANAESFFVFPKITPNLNEQYVNLFNNHLSAGFDESDTYYYWRCYIDDARSLYFGAFDDSGLWVIDVKDPQNMKTLQSEFYPPNSNGDIDTLIFLKSGRYLVIPVVDAVHQYVITVYDTMPNGPLPADFTLSFKQGVAHTTTNYIVDFDVNSDETLLAGALGDSVIFFDVTTPGLYTVKAVWQFEAGMKGDCTGIMITMSDDYLIGASRGFGYFILDIQDLSAIKMVQYIDSLGAENLVASDISNDYCFFIDGLRGIFVVDLKQLPLITYISNILIPGWSNDITFLNDEKLMLVSTMQKSMVTMVDIKDIKNPFIVTEYLYETQNGMSTCAFADNSFIFVNNNIGVRALPTEGDVVMHVEVEQILGFSDELDSFIYKKMDIEDIFKVGQVIQLDIVFLYQPLDLLVNKLIFYQSQTMFDLPTWIMYDPDEVSIKINVVKESIDPTNSNEPLLNVIIVKTLNPLYVDDFQFVGGNCPTNAGQSQIIYDYVLQNGIIDDQNIVSPDLEFPDEQMLIITGYTYADANEKLCLSKLLKYTLLRSIQYTPIYLFMQSSLILTLSPALNQSYVDTVSRTISVNLRVTKFSGSFIFENQISVNISINDEKNEIEISGILSNVNNFLNGKIILFPIAPHTFATIIAVLTIEDGFNYPIQKSIEVSNISFVVEKQNIEINDKQLLQSQLSDDYSNGEIEIISDFIFQFDESTFISPDIGTVKYNAFIESGGEYVEMDQSSWLQFNPEGYKFFGNPPQSAFNTVIKIKLVGDDGYTKIEDTFEIRIFKLPVLFVIQWISQILGPIIGAIGFYKYRNYYYNSCFKNKNRYSKVSCQVNERFVLKIPLISHELKQAKQMIEGLLAQVNKSGGVNLNKIAKKNTIKIEEPDYDDFEQEQDKKAEKAELELQDLEANDLQQDQGQADINTAAINNNNNNQQAKGGIRMQGNTKQVWNTDKSDITQQFHDKILMAKPYAPQSEAEKKYLSSEGKINMDEIVADMLKFNIKFDIIGKEQKAQAYKDELNNSKSVIHKCIKLIFGRYFLSLDRKTMLVSEYIRYYGKRNCFLHTQNDWYKQFVSVISDDQLDPFGHTIIFPKVKMLIENINTALLHLQIISSRLQSLEFLTSQKINPYLIKTVLKAEALGIQLQSPSSIFPSSGESIHLKSHELRSVESFKYSPGGSCFSLKKCLNLEYDPYGPKENMQFPNWLQLIMQSGVIMLSGTPQLQDMEEVLIRFYGHQGYIYRSFTLRVQDSQGNSSRSQVISSKTKQKQNLKKSEFALLENHNKNSSLQGDEFGQDMDSIQKFGENKPTQQKFNDRSIHPRNSNISKQAEIGTPVGMPLILPTDIQKKSLFNELDINL